MDKDRGHLIEGFSKRLIATLKERGFTSRTSRYGVRATELADTLNCSVTRARNYISGKNAPDYTSALIIADWLNVDPGWLTYGAATQSSEKISIDRALLKEIMIESVGLFQENINPEAALAFLEELIVEASTLKADKHEILKMVKMAIKSSSRLREKQKVQCK